MSNRNKTEKNIPPINKDKNIKKYNSSRNKNLIGKISSLKKQKKQLSKVILKGKLFSLINKSNIMTEDQFNEIKIKISLSQLEKYKIAKKNLKKQFYYAQQNPNILHPNKNPSKFEDDYINMRDLLKKFTNKEQEEILSFPQFFQLNSNEFLKELVEEKHKNLYEIITNEENKEIELKNFRMKQREELNSDKNNYNKTHHNNRQSILKNKESEEGSLSNNNRVNKSNDYYSNKSKKNKKIIFNIKNKFLSRNDNDKNNFLLNKEAKTYDYNNIFQNKKKFFFEGNIWNKNKLTNLEMNEKIREKYDKLKKRKELMILDKERKIEEAKERNLREQFKKEKERQKIYQEKKFIDYISNKLKKNYTIKEELMKKQQEQKEQKEKIDLIDKDKISSILSLDSERKSIF